MQLRNIARVFVQAFIGLALPLQSPPSVLAQDATRGIDLNGYWKMDDGYVYIVHRGTTVMGIFELYGACLGGTQRPYAIDGQLSSTITPAAIVHSITGSLWVCTRSPKLIGDCGGRVASAYETTFTDAQVEENRIFGKRVAQGILDCAPNRAYDDTHDFELTRNACIKQELDVAHTEEMLRVGQRTLTTDKNFLDISAAHSAAVARYRDRFTFENWTVHTDILLDPYWVLSGNHTPEEFFERLRDRIEEMASLWSNTKRAAELMARDGLTEAAPVVVILAEMEDYSRNAQQRHLPQLRKYREALDACRKANPARSPGRQ